MKDFINGLFNLSKTIVISVVVISALMVLITGIVFGLCIA